ncbi:serine/threonine-protein kinase 31 isoform X3 [Microcaecilia unicolor]|uniref:Serine/threonine-protein kinase 31 isoform X3 n=1 Tax=Microcaecilia unicolor TaxID=1415580 RepID=A0A6P7XXW4_9AMPH|nr:serine/threonine-protein kinase 31 isoform X3 [Microcaecilia unicolor]
MWTSGIHTEEEGGCCRVETGTVKMDEEMAFNQAEDVFVSHIEDGVTFWAQNIEKNSEIAEITSELARICPTMNQVFGNPDLCKIYGGLFSEDRCWYRCKLQQVISDEMCMVTYIDYGNSENLNRSNIVELPESLQLPSIAKKYRLWGLQLPSNTELSQFDKAKQFLSSLIFEKQIRVCHKVIYKDNTVVVQAEFGNTDIGEEVAKKGFAERCKSISSMNYNGDRKMDDTVCQPKNTNLPSPVWKNRYVENIPVVEQQNVQLINRQRVCFSNQSSPERRCERNALFKKERLVVPEHINMMKAKQEQKLMEEEKLKAERDSALQNCKALESQVEQLNVDFQKKREASEEMVQNLERSLESSVSNKLRDLSTKIELLRKVRHGQANVNICFGDDLSEAVRIVTLECLAVPSSLHKLDENWTEYNLAQEMIRLCKDIGEVDTSIAKRNVIQQNLYSVVEEFIAEAENLPFFNRTASLQALSRLLSTAYGQVIEVEDSENIFDEFHEWKCRKMEDFQRVRKDTDDSLAELLLWFCRIQNSFDLTSEVALDSDDVVGDIDGLLTKVKSFLDKELAISLVDQDDMDKKIILNAYSNVIKKVQEEEQLIRVVELKYEASVEFKKQIMECLNKSPNIDHLLSIKKTIKCLKAQLRWKLVEKSNMEEMDEYSNSDMKEIKEEIVDLRNKIFQEIILEQEEYENLSNLVQKWLPELPLLHPEAGILNYMASGGLLSMSLERDLLDGEPMKELSSKRPLVRSEVMGQNVLLKGYPLGVDTEATVMVKAAEYHKAWSELKEKSGLLPLMFLFFCKSDPLAYLMIPFYPGESLGAVQTTEPLAIAEIIKVMKGVACGLQTLHKSNLVHGAMHPNNTFAVDRKKGIVGDFDFTKTADQRSSANSFGSLILAAPELKMGQPASPSTDMYAYGCLLLWLCTRNDTFKMSPDGTPHINELDMDIKIKNLISRLIRSGDRMTAVHVVADDCFCLSDAVCVLSPTIDTAEDSKCGDGGAAEEVEIEESTKCEEVEPFQDC